MKTTIKRLSRTSVLVLFSLAISMPVLAEDFYRTLVFNLKPGESQAFQDLMMVALEDTRNFKGCQYLAMLVDNDDPNKVFLYEVWDAEESYKAYSAWRTETRFVEQIGRFLAGPPAANSYTLLQD